MYLSVCLCVHSLTLYVCVCVHSLALPVCVYTLLRCMSVCVYTLLRYLLLDPHKCMVCVCVSVMMKVSENCSWVCRPANCHVQVVVSVVCTSVVPVCPQTLDYNQVEHP